MVILDEKANSDLPSQISGLSIHSREDHTLSTPSEVSSENYDEKRSSGLTYPPPPSYVESAASLAPSVDSSTTNAGVNFLEIGKKDGSIKGSWVVNTELSIRPPNAAEGIDADDERPNLSLVTRDGDINAEIELVGGQRRAIIYAATRDGSVIIKLINPHSQAIHLQAITRDGKVQIHLPHSYNGLITGTSGDGKVKFSDEMTKTLTPLSEKNGKKKCFLGSIKAISQTDTVWNGDEVSAETKDGDVIFSFMDSEPNSSS